MRSEKYPVQFLEKRSILHILHPISKLIWICVISLTLIFNQDYFLGLLLFFFIIVLFYIGGLPLFNIKGIKIIVLSSIFIALLQLIFNSNGKQLFSFLSISITDDGIRRAIYLSSRFCSIILLGFIFIFTTNPNELVYSMMHAGISYRLGFSFISAFRFISFFTEEIEKIYYSSLIKGVSYKFFPMRNFYQNLVNYFRLVFVSIFEKVDALVLSMEGRGFGSEDKRTYLRIIPYKISDFFLIFIAVVWFCLFITWTSMNFKGS